MMRIRSAAATMLLLLFHILVFLPAGIMTDLTSDRAALISLRSAVGGRTLFWTTTQQNPCNWSGVQCDNATNRVTALHLPGDSLYGQLPVGIFGNLTKLKTLSIRFNALSGPLPSDLSSCLDLRNLYLQGNSFSGPFPENFFGSLRDLVRLNLAGNNFSGEITTGFNNFTRLRTLYLENNQFSGSLPDLKIPNLEQFNVSFNNLNGSVPKTLQSNPKESFLGTSLCGSPLDEICPAKEDVPPAVSVDLDRNRKKKKGLSGGAIAGIVIGSVLGFIVLLLLLFILCRKRSTKKTSSIDISASKQTDAEVLGEKPLTGSGTGSNGFSVAAAAAAAMTTSSTAAGGGADASGNKKLVFFRNSSTIFDLEDLLRASAEVLGKGTFGTAYKAVLEAGMMVAVKRLKDVAVPEPEFREKIEFVGAMDHQNLVPLRAYYYSKEEKLLVYDYMPMGSLSALLHGNKGGGRTPLNWETRSTIALGAARGIEYLHSHGQDISHGNIKSSNVLLTKSLEARISDFGLAHLVGGLPSTPNRVAGYRAPEVTDPRRVSQKADVYSFGVLLLELLTGKAPTHALLNEEGVDLPRWVQSTVKEEWTSEVFDLELLRYQTVEEEMVQLLQVAIDCAAQFPDNRPNMAEVCRRIEEVRRSSVMRGDVVHESD